MQQLQLPAAAASLNSISPSYYILIHFALHPLITPMDVYSLAVHNKMFAQLEYNFFLHFL